MVAAQPGWQHDVCATFHRASRSCAQVIRHFEFYTQRPGARRYKFDVLITTFELSLKDAALLSEVKWSYLVVDEAHRLKNNESALYKVCAPALAAVAEIGCPV